MSSPADSHPQRNKSGPGVALLIETSSSWGIRIIEGIARYAKARCWRLDLELSSKHDRLSLPVDWKGGGIIARVTSLELARQISASGCPAVNVSWFDFTEPRIPRCTADEDATGRIAAQHLNDRGLRNMAYCGSWRRPGYEDRLLHAFGNGAARYGVTCASFLPPPHMSALARADQIAELGGWLTRLQRPVGILTFDSEIAYRLAEACRLTGLPVPQEVAILSAEHDELFTTIATPSLSAIDLAPQRVGYEAAALLDKIFAGETHCDDVLVQPTGVLTRQSTDLMAHSDRELAAALRFIRENSHRAIQVVDILAEVPISRRSLEQKFLTHLGRSPGAEIRRERVERAKKMLRETDVPLNVIASRCGFDSAQALATAFRGCVGVAPSSFRRNTC